ncbi:GNAT family N-acetyltransferase [Frigoribacterium sp. CFBP 13707]|uniref:GNAT family N-acetyltransferase n=1 Tax=Frigoribacterium sp. CFBP 13707 TaxID=2775313 RepID=UPI001781A551|nr:GNAT family N-acetyltransferase [Frigoribacterium sp. CFBP 13707]
MTRASADSPAGPAGAAGPAAAAPRYLGVDLAWRDSTPGRPANETGLAVVAADGTVLDAGWARGVDAVEEWVLRWATPGSVVAIDAPVLVPNATGMRASEREVSRSYGRWHVAANASSASLPWLGGRDLGERLERAGLVLDDGVQPVPEGRTSYFECYPYTTLVGAAELGYDERRPRYKRPDTTLPPEARREARAAVCDDLLRRLGTLSAAAPALQLRSHPVSRLLLDEPSPLVDRAYKHREDLLDALLCAWTASLRAQAPGRLQVLGHATEPDARGRRATILTPCRDGQRRQPAPQPLRGHPVASAAAPGTPSGPRGGVTVRPTTADDWREVRDLRLEMLADTPRAFGETLAAAQPLDEQAWRLRAARGTSATGVFLAAVDEADGRWLGTMGGYLPEPGHPVLVGVYVTPTSRGAAAGVADALLDGVVEWARGHGDALFLQVHEANDRAIAFYRRRGFAPTGATSPYPLDPTALERELRLPLQ